MEALKPRNILNKEPFGYLLPQVYSGRVSDGTAHEVNHVTAPFQEISQIDFMREYDPRSHKIWDSNWFEDEKKQDPESKLWYIYPVERCALPFQYIITVKQLTHLCGNNIEFKDSNPNPTDEDKSTLIEYEQGWLNKNMEVAWYDSAKSVKITGDAAFCGYLHNGEFGHRVFSFLNGDTLYPHYNYVTGKLDLFGREYSQYDEKGKQRLRILEVWDNKNLYRFKRNTTGVKKVINKLVEWLGLGDGWDLISTDAHNFPFIPISYKRAKYGACWVFVQDLIDQYEKDFSRYLQMNKSNANPIIVITGDDIEVKGDSKRPITSISVGPGGSADRIGGGNVSTSFESQLRINRECIFMGAFTVLPPEEKSGDKSGVYIKIQYSPAIEQAMADANEFNEFIDDVVKIFKYGFSVEVGKVVEYNNLKVSGEIIPFIHQNEAELMTNLLNGVTGGFLSKESAAEQSPYKKNDEVRRLKSQMKDELGADSITDVMYKTGNKETKVEEITAA